MVIRSQYSPIIFNAIPDVNAPRFSVKILTIVCHPDPKSSAFLYPLMSNFELFPFFKIFSVSKVCGLLFIFLKRKVAFRHLQNNSSYGWRAASCQYFETILVHIRKWAITYPTLWLATQPWFSFVIAHVYWLVIDVCLFLGLLVFLTSPSIRLL